MMSKARTGVHLLFHPQKFKKVIEEKLQHHVSEPYEKWAMRRHTIHQIKHAAKANFSHEGVSSEDFNKYYCRLKNPSKKALLFSLFIGTSGNLASTNYYTNWIIGLRENGIDAVWLAQEMTSGPEVDIGTIDGPLLLAPYKDLNFNVQKILNQEKPDLILCHNNPVSIDFLENNDTYGALKFVFIGDSMIPRIKDEFLRADHIKKVMKQADGLIVVSNYLKKSWEEYGFDSTKIFVTKTPVCASRWPEHQGSGTQSKAAYFGNVYHKEIDNLLDIAPLVKQKIPEFTVTVYGDGAEADLIKLQEKINDRRLQNTVLLHGSVPYKEMQNIQSKMDVLLLPREGAEFSFAGFPNKLGEYLASGCPAVVTRVGEIETVVSDCEHAYLVEPNDNSKFADAVIRCLSDQESSLMMAQRGKERIHLFASPKNVISEFLDWVNESYEKN